MRSSLQSWRIRSNDLRRKRASPTDSASSMIRMSGSMVTATAKREPAVHAGRVGPHRHVHEVLELGEVDDLVVLLGQLGAREARGEAAEHHVLAAGELAVEADAEREQRADAAVDLDAAAGSAAGCRRPSRISVDLPAPLAPTTPITLPCGTSNETFLTASISRTTRSRAAEAQQRAPQRRRASRATCGRSPTRPRRGSGCDQRRTANSRSRDMKNSAPATNRTMPQAAPSARSAGSGARALVEDVAPRRQQRGDRVDARAGTGSAPASRRRSRGSATRRARSAARS